MREEERRELEAVAAALGSSSRLLRLVTYIGDRYFEGDIEKLREYEIATEVFGRSRSTFNPGEDAIVRVEAHRLRKRLKEYYENEGKGHPVQMTIPPGTYVPVFVRCATAAEPAISESEAPPADSEAEPTHWSPKWWYFAAAIAAAAILLFGADWIFRSHPAHSGTANAAAAVPVPGPAAAGPYAHVPLRILAGYSGKPQIDSSGDVWEPDEYFHEGGNWHVSTDFIARTNDPMLFEHFRNGTFSYDIPLRPGVYELHLYFMALNRNGGQPATFSVTANGQPLLTNIDVNSDAMGPYIADERIFRDISPGADGFLHLNFTGVSTTAEVNAIEILPGLPHRQLPVRLVMQPTSFTDHSGQLWQPDDYYLEGYAGVKGLAVTGTSDAGLYAAERYGHFSYAIPVDTRDQYTLVLHFAELYFGPHVPGGGGVGSRVFSVMCNGNTLLNNFDIYKQAGSLHALTETFYHLKPSTEGKLNITFEPITNFATVSAIEVLDESQ
jgi:hypothetical protein